MKDKVFYLSGPMSDIPDYNIPEFTRLAAELRESGLTIVVPHELTAHMDFTHSSTEGAAELWRDCMRADITGMMHNCTDIILMPGWYQSQGAWLELTLARALGFGVWFYQPDPIDPGFEEGVLISMDRESYL